MRRLKQDFQIDRLAINARTKHMVKSNYEKNLRNPPHI